MQVSVVCPEVSVSDGRGEEGVRREGGGGGE